VVVCFVKLLACIVGFDLFWGGVACLFVVVDYDLLFVDVYDLILIVFGLLVLRCWFCLIWAFG